MFYHQTPSHNSTKEQHTESDEKYKSTEKKYYHRLLAVLHNNNGRIFADIAKEHGVSIRSVQRWISAYIQMGTEGREIKKTSNTKSRIRTDEKNRDYAFCTFQPSQYLWLHQKHLESGVAGKQSVLQKNLIFLLVSDIYKEY